MFLYIFGSVFLSMCDCVCVSIYVWLHVCFYVCVVACVFLCMCGCVFLWYIMDLYYTACPITAIIREFCIKVKRNRSTILSLNHDHSIIKR